MANNRLSLPIPETVFPPLLNLTRTDAEPEFLSNYCMRPGHNAFSSPQTPLIEYDCFGRREG